MILSRAGLLETLKAGGVAPSALNMFFARLNANNFATVSREWVDAVFDAAVEELSANAPSLVEVVDLGAGRSRRVPRYVLNGFCCRGHSLAIYAHGLIGFALKGAAAAADGAPLTEDGLAWGFLEYVARPRPENRMRAGPHECLWFVDPDGVFQTFEPGDGDEHEFTDVELASIRYVFAQ